MTSRVMQSAEVSNLAGSSAKTTIQAALKLHQSRCTASIAVLQESQELNEYLLKNPEDKINYLSVISP